MTTYPALHGERTGSCTTNMWMTEDTCPNTDLLNDLIWARVDKLDIPEISKHRLHYIVFDEAVEYMADGEDAHTAVDYAFAI